MKNLKKILMNSLIVGWTTGAIVLGTYFTVNGARLDRDMKKANIVLERKELFGRETIGGFDYDKDGNYDRIIVHGSVASDAAVAFPYQLDLNPGNIQFDRYESLLAPKKIN